MSSAVRHHCNETRADIEAAIASAKPVDLAGKSSRILSGLDLSGAILYGASLCLLAFIGLLLIFCGTPHARYFSFRPIHKIATVHASSGLIRGNRDIEEL